MSKRRELSRVGVDRDAKRRGVLRRYQKGMSIPDCARLAGCSYESARRWVREAERNGFDEALKPRRHENAWPIEFKRKVVEEYLLGASPAELMAAYRLPHANYPGLWAKKMKAADMPADSEALAKGAWRKAVASNLAGDAQWQDWVKRMRAHFDQACQDASSDEERLRLMRMQVDLMEKSSALSSSQKSPKQVLIDTVTGLKASYPVRALLRAVGIAPSTYYWNLKRQMRPDQDVALKEQILLVHQTSRKSYGYRRVCLALRNGANGHEPLVINHKKVHRLMRCLGIQGKRPVKKRYNSFKGGDPTGVNHLNRHFHPSKPHQVLVTDITMFTVGNTKLYFSPLIDLFNNQVVSWRLATHAEAPVVVGMLNEGLKKLPAGSKPLIHSDQGNQYTSNAWKQALKGKATQSMSRVGNCHDNAPAESFFARIKTELEGHQARTPNQFHAELADYLNWWNKDRIVTRLGTSPLNYLKQAA